VEAVEASVFTFGGGIEWPMSSSDVSYSEAYGACNLLDLVPGRGTESFRTGYGGSGTPLVMGVYGTTPA
jgi:hypothetical protein